MITIIRPNTRQEWLELRTHGFGSSEVAAICGLSKYESPRHFWHKKRQERAGNIVELENNATQFGHWLEDGVAQAFQDVTSHKVIASSKGDWIAKNDEKPYLQASPDRLFWFDADGKKNAKNKAILECKTTNLRLDEENEDLVEVKNVRDGEEVVIRIPISWYCQVQYQLWACGMQHAALAYMRLMSREFNYCYIERDDAFIATMSKDLDGMWQALERGEEPDATTVEDATESWPDCKAGSVREADAETASAYYRIKELDEAMKPFKKERESLATQLKIYAEDNESIAIGGNVIATYKKSAGKKVFNEGMFRIENPDLYDKYLEDKEGTKSLRIK